MPGPIGVTFMPNAENQQNGPRQGGLEGPGSTDLAQAFKVLSLRLPQVLGARAPAPASLLNAPGAAGVAAPGQNSNAAIFQALLKTMMGGSMNGPAGPSMLSTAMPSDATKFGFVDGAQSPGTTQQIGPDDFIARGGGRY